MINYAYINIYYYSVKRMSDDRHSMSGVQTGRILKAKKVRQVKSRKVLGMMAIMQDRNNQEVPKEFLETGRTGRRNAMPDILHPQGAEISTADLPSRLQQLVTTDPIAPQPSSSQCELDIKKPEEPPGDKKGCS